MLTLSGVLVIDFLSGDAILISPYFFEVSISRIGFSFNLPADSAYSFDSMVPLIISPSTSSPPN